MARKYAPLRTSFMATSIIGFFVSVFYVYGISPKWGAAFSILFFAMFIASFISMIKANPDAQLRALPIKSHTVIRRKNKKRSAKKHRR